MGWFNKIINTETHEITFSSPSGDGLVQNHTYALHDRLSIFVPEWGWVGSPTDSKSNDVNTIFVPEWGWVGSGIINRLPPQRKKFSSPSGDGLVLQILTEILKNQVIRYRHNKQL